MKITKISKKAQARFLQKEMKEFFLDFFGKEVGLEYYKTFKTKEKTYLFSAVDGKKTVGTIRLQIGRKVARIGAFVVAKSHRKGGVGTELLEKCEKLARKKKCIKIWLWTLPTINAYKFYRCRGYVEEARLKKHFGGQDLCVMSKFL